MPNILDKIFPPRKCEAFLHFKEATSNGEVVLL